MTPLDVITIGRSSVDLYGAQVGGRLEDMRSFDKYIGGSPTNIAVGTARLGLKSALITRVGDEHMGRFIREQLSLEGVATTGVVTDPARLTALVLLGIRDQKQFPLIFYREDCADMALCEDDIDPDFIASARAVVATGTHLSNPRTKAAVLKALRLARDGGQQTALDIDYRPNLWGLAGHGAGEERFIASTEVTEALQATLPLFDLIVGTEEEFHIAGGTTDTIEALRNVRAVSSATLVCKRGPMGAAAFAGAIPDTLDEGESGPGFPIEVFNVLGAGDGFMSGLLKGWLDGKTWSIALTYANACGALAVSRHGCAPAYPSWDELAFFLERGVTVKALRHDAALEQIHWSTNRLRDWPFLRIFTFDRSAELEAMPDATPDKIRAFKSLCATAVTNLSADQAGLGLQADAQYAMDALYRAPDHGLWIGRRFDLSQPLTPAINALSEWPRDHVVCCRVEASRFDQDCAALEQVFLAARHNRLELLVALNGTENASDLAQRVQLIYNTGVFPDWWALPVLSSSADWTLIAETITQNDANIGGMIVTDTNAGSVLAPELIKLAAETPMIKGFSVGSTILQNAAKPWMQGVSSDAETVAQMTQDLQSVLAVWDQIRAGY